MTIRRSLRAMIPRGLVGLLLLGLLGCEDDGSPAAGPNGNALTAASGDAGRSVPAPEDGPAANGDQPRPGETTLRVPGRTWSLDGAKPAPDPGRA